MKKLFAVLLAALAAPRLKPQPPRLLLLRHLLLKPPLPKRLPLRPERFLS